MITYLGITLNNRRFYVGSAVDFERRQKAHLKSRDNYPFQNALRKDPDNVYWIASDDDGSDGREEEQFYLDFYHGSEWCYNLSDNVKHPGRDASVRNGLETSAAMVEQKRGWMNPEFRLRGGDSAQRKFGIGVLMTSPGGEETYYPSYKKASQATGVPIGTIADMCKGSKSKKWDWTAKHVDKEET